MYGMVGTGSGDPGNNDRKYQYRSGSQTTKSQSIGQSASGGDTQGGQPKSFYRRLLAFVKGAWTGVKFGSELELEDIELEPKYRPENLNALCKATNFSKSELQRLYRSFKSRYPSGVVTEDEFKKMYCQMFPKGASSRYAHYVYQTLDREKEGSIKFQNLILLLSQLGRGTHTERLRWIFSLYDLNGDGCITRREMTEVVQAVYDLMGRQTTTPVDEATIAQKVDVLFSAIDLNKDGVITLEEFLDYCSTDSILVQNLEAMAEFL